MKRRTFTIAILIGCVGLLTLWAHRSFLDGIDGWILEHIYADDTEYATGYSDQAFRAIARGQTEREIRSALGPPLVESWSYEKPNHEAHVIIFDEAGHVAPSIQSTYPDVKRLVGGAKSDVLNLLGEPTIRTFIYSRSKGGGSYRIRSLEFRGSSVARTIHSYYWD